MSVRAACIERGSETVQFAVAAPLLFALLFSIMQVGGTTLAASQVASEITRASLQLDSAGLEQTTDKNSFIEREILGSATQLRPDALQVENASWRRERDSIQAVREGSAIEQRTSLASVSYDVRYRIPSIVKLPGLAGRVLERHVECVLVDGRVVELSVEPQ